MGRCAKQGYSSTETLFAKGVLIIFALMVVIGCVFGYSSNDILRNGISEIVSQVEDLIDQFKTNATVIVDDISFLNANFDTNITSPILDDVLHELNKVSNQSTTYNSYINKIDLVREIFVNLAYAIPLVGCVLVIIAVFTSSSCLTALVMTCWAITITMALTAGGLNAPVSVTLSDLCPIMDEEIIQLAGKNDTNTTFFGLCPNATVVDDLVSQTNATLQSLYNCLNQLENDNPRNETAIAHVESLINVTINLTDTIQSLVSCEAVQVTYDDIKGVLCVDIRNTGAFVVYFAIAFALVLAGGKLAAGCAKNRFQRKLADEDTPLLGYK